MSCSAPSRRLRSPRSSQVLRVVEIRRSRPACSFSSRSAPAARGAVPRARANSPARAFAHSRSKSTGSTLSLLRAATIASRLAASQLFFRIGASPRAPARAAQDRATCCRGGDRLSRRARSVSIAASSTGSPSNRRCSWPCSSESGLGGGAIAPRVEGCASVRIVLPDHGAHHRRARRRLSFVSGLGEEDAASELDHGISLRRCGDGSVSRGASSTTRRRPRRALHRVDRLELDAFGRRLEVAQARAETSTRDSSVATSLL